jgi:hypothetical protein
MYIKLPMYLAFSYMAPGLNDFCDFDGGKSITRATGTGGPLQMDLPESKPSRPALYKQQGH